MGQAPQEIKMLFAVLPETNRQGFFYQFYKKFTFPVSDKPIPWISFDFSFAVAYNTSREIPTFYISEGERYVSKRFC